MKKEIRVQLPDGCNDAKVQVENGMAIVEFLSKEKDFNPKEGDFCMAELPERSIFIYSHRKNPSSYLNYHVLYSTGRLYYGSNIFINEVKYRFATEAEKQELINALTKEGKYWNAEKMCIDELPRWRANKGECYFYVNRFTNINLMRDYRDDVDAGLYSLSNYFKTEEAAQKVAGQIREIFKNSKVE